MAPLYRDEEILALLDRALTARDRDEQLRLVHELERRWLSEQVALVPLGYGYMSWLRRPWVEGFWTTPLLGGRISDIVIHR